MTPDLEAIRKRCEVATAGPWEWLDQFLFSPVEDEGVLNHEGTHWPVSRENANFIAHARTDIPALCDEVERLRAELATVRRERDSERAGRMQWEELYERAVQDTADRIVVWLVRNAEVRSSIAESLRAGAWRPNSGRGE